MTLRLILMRHAKSAWDDPCAPDHDRDLNQRGRDSAQAVGQWLADQNYGAEVVICSTALRTVQTWKRVAPHMAPSTRVELSSALYHAPAMLALRLLRARKEQAVMMLGHNPGIGTFAEGLVRDRPTHPQFSRYPTAATAVIDFDVGSFADLTPNSGRLVDFVVPRELV